MSRPGLEQLEQSDLDVTVAVVWLVSGEVPVPDAELKAARRRAMLILAAGGDPHRDLDQHEVAVDRLAAEIDTPERRQALAAALATIDASGLPRVSAAVDGLLADQELAWRTFALALLADELAEE